MVGGPTIDVRTNGTLKCGNGVSATFSGHTIKLNGGRWVYNGGIITAGDTVALESDSQIAAGGGQDAQWILSGLIRDGFGGGKGKLSINTSNLWVYNQGRGLVDLTGANNTYSGGTVIYGNFDATTANYSVFSNGMVRALAPGALGQGDVQLLAGGYLGIGTNNTTAAGKTITVEAGGGVLLGFGGGGVTFNSQGHHFLFKEGALLRSGLASTTANRVNSYDAYALEGAAQFKNNTEGQFHIYGPITNGASAGKMVVNASKLGAGYYIYLRNPSNTFSGGIDIQAGGYLSIATNGAQGVGPITPLTATSYVELDQTPNADWTVTNTLAGKGTIKVEAGNGANLLTCGGTVNPGIGGATVTTNTTGILTINGALGFASGGQLTIDIAGANGVAGVDFDRLVVNYALTNLNNATLYVNVATNLARNALVGQEFIVVTNSTALKSTFASVSSSGDGAGKVWTFQVVTNQPSGTVKLAQLYLHVPGSPIVDAANGATNVTANSAWLNGTLVDAGAAPASVSVYWGTNDGGTVQSAWGNTNDFGFCTNGQALTTNVTGLAPGAIFYYRYYATNSAGYDEWSDAATFMTLQTPVVTTNGGATLVTKTTAQLNGILTAGGRAQVTIFWGTDSNAWANTNQIGPVLNGVPFQIDVSRLLSGTIYYYVCYATNAAGSAYSDTATFTTLAGTPYVWQTNNGLWDAAANWNPAGGPPGVGDFGTITNGLTCIANTNLAGGPFIEVQTNATLKCGNGVGATFSGHTIKLNGGKWVYNGGIITAGDTVALESDSQIAAGGGQDAWWILSGLIRDGFGGGKGKLSINTSNLYVRTGGRGWVDLAATNNSYSGGTVIYGNFDATTANYSAFSNGMVRALAPGALGQGDVQVLAGGNLNIGTNNTTAAGKTITVGAGGGVLLGIGTGGVTFNSQGHNFLFKEGSMLRSGLYNSVNNRVNSYDAYALEGAAQFKNNTEGYFHIYGLITDGTRAGKMVVEAPKLPAYPYIYLYNSNNTFSGGLDIRAGGYVSIATNGAQGVGPITPLTATSYVELDQTPNADWTVTNTLAGKGTIKVEAGNGANRLTCGGTVNPGIGGATVTTNTTGILRVDGGMAFGAGSRLKIDIAGTNGVAGADFDRLLVDHTLTGISNAVLEVDVSTNLGPSALIGQELIVVSNAAALASSFARVEWSGAWGGVVKIDEPTGTVKLTKLQLDPNLPYVRVAAATGVVETAAWLNGMVVATGSTPPVVWAYWGQTSGGTNAGAWAASTNLGVCVQAPPADFTFQATGLVSGRTYVYRYYVQNDAGGTWSPTEASFRTFGPPLVDNAGGATGVRGYSATLNGTVTAGRPDPDTYVCLGTSDGGTGSTGAWQRVESLGALDGAFARAIGGLTPGQTYFYRCYATNSYGFDWADTAATFTTRPYDDFAWRGLGADNNWTTPANWSPSTSAPTQTWEWAMFEVAAARQPVADRAVALTTVQVSGTNAWTWGGSAAVSLSQGLDYGSSGTSVWNAALAGAGGVTVTAGQLTLANATNSYTGETWIKGGRLHAPGRMSAGVTGVLGASPTPLRLGDTNGSADATLSFANGGVAVTHDRAISVEAGSSGKAVLWSQPAAGGQTLGGTLALGKDTEFRTEGGSALTLGANPTGAGALLKSGAQTLFYSRPDSPGHTGGTRIQGGLLQWVYTAANAADTTLRFGGGAGLLALDGGQFELKGTEEPGVRLTLDNPVRVTTNGGALAASRSEGTAQTWLTGGIALGGPLTVGSLTAGSLGALSYRGAITLDQTAGGARALLLNHTGSDVEFRGAIADGPGTNALTLQVGIVAGGAAGTPFKLSGTNATYAGGTVFTGGRVTLTNPKAVGPGPLTVWSNAICHLARSTGATNWVFAQDLAGSGTVQVEAGANTYQLLSQGATVSAGVGAGDVGTLTIAGRYAFGTNAVGQASRLSIDLVATSTNAAAARADLLRVDHGDAALAASLAQCDLVVNMALAPGVTTLQGSFTILTNTYAKADFTGQAFRSVTINGGLGTVRYATGYVELDVDIKPRPTGALLIVR